ncbi:hypothetical protein niasHT_008405 [Heterodera trifolii]|uniref:Uncharacterized protein n=1 Tax=Heterodera trifolii TaxID=157864 RepID=A0ABD2LPA1_9BILA
MRPISLCLLLLPLLLLLLLPSPFANAFEEGEEEDNEMRAQGQLAMSANANDDGTEEDDGNEMRAQWPSPQRWTTRPTRPTYKPPQYPRPGPGRPSYNPMPQPMGCGWSGRNQRSGAILLPPGSSSFDGDAEEGGLDNEMRVEHLTPCPPRQPYPAPRPTNPPQYPPGRPGQGGPGQGKGWGSNSWHGNGNNGKGGGGGGRPNHRSGDIMLLKPATMPRPKYRPTSPPFLPIRTTPWPFPTFGPRPLPTRWPYRPGFPGPRNIIPGMASSN